MHSRLSWLKWYDFYAWGLFFMVSLTCKSCGKNFTVPNNRADKAIVCSRECYSSLKKKNVIGKHFYRLTIINEAPPEFQKKKNCKLQKIRHVYCKCLCGNYVTVRLIGLKHGDTKSCGCVKKEQNNINISELKHGLSDHPLYYIWKNMIGRCTDVKNIRYNCYGARWISVCERWTDFELFFLDMNDGYLNGLSIERVDNDGNYEPKNCKWATRLEQANNTRRTWWVEYMGEKIAFSLACRQLGLDIEKVRKVMRKNNFDFDLFVKKIFE